MSLALVGKANKRNVEIEHIHEILDRKIGRKKNEFFFVAPTNKHCLKKFVAVTCCKEGEAKRASERTNEKAKLVITKVFEAVFARVMQGAKTRQFDDIQGLKQE